MQIEVTRGPVVESVHRVDVAVVDARGNMRAWAGDPDRFTYLRSAAKPFQALPLVEDGAARRFGIPPAELAVACGSHSGEPMHVRAVQSLLSRAGATSEDLACGSHPPFHRPSREALRERGVEPGRLHNNCSGKHAGMIALARCHGWQIDGYTDARHPVQARVLKEIARWTRRPLEGIALGNDGCGTVCFGLPLREMALAYARLAAAARSGEGAPRAVVEAMIRHPEMVAGTGRVCTDVMRRTGGRVFAKLGAEGIYCVGVPGAELGIALKVEDGSRRAVPPAILAVLHRLDLLSDADVGALDGHAYPEVHDTAGVPVGLLRPRVELRTSDG